MKEKLFLEYESIFNLMKGLIPVEPIEASIWRKILRLVRGLIFGGSYSLVCFIQRLRKKRG